MFFWKSRYRWAWRCDLRVNEYLKSTRRPFFSAPKRGHECESLRTAVRLGSQKLAVADGALGFWQAIQEVWTDARPALLLDAQDRQCPE
jgi:hypothetical protein